MPCQFYSAFFSHQTDLGADQDRKLRVGESAVVQSEPPTRPKDMRPLPKR